MATIMLAEDIVPETWRLESRLVRLGHRVTSVSCGEVAEMVKRHPYDLIIGEVNFPDEETSEMLRQVRLFSDMPFLGIRTSGTSDLAREYMRKHLDGMVSVMMDDETLEETLEESLRVSYKKTHNIQLYQYKKLKISNSCAKKAEINHQPLDLTIKEFMIISLLMRHRERIYTKANLYEAVWHKEYTGDDNAIKIHISNLRNKLKKADPAEAYIETVWGLGYRLCKS